MNYESLISMNNYKRRLELQNFRETDFKVAYGSISYLVLDLIELILFFPILCSIFPILVSKKSSFF